MKRNKIMLIAEKYDGGVKTHLEILINNLALFDLYQVILKGDLNPPPQNQDNCERIFLKDFSVKNPFKLYRNAKLIKDVIIENDIDLVHLHSTSAGITGILLAGLLRNRKVKFLYTPHAYYSQKPDLNIVKRFLVVQIEKLICIYPSTIIHVSKGEEKHALLNKIVKKAKSVVIYNGIKQRAKLKKTPSSSFVFGNLARVDVQKNPQRFLEIAAYMISNSKMPLKFVFGGEGPLLKDMISLISKEKLQGKVEFIGFVEDIDAFFSSIDGYLSTSHYEGLPYSVVEAASFGIPLFLSDVIGHNEMIHGNGILFDLNASNEEIGEAILGVIEREDLMAEHRAASVGVFEQLFEESKMIEQIKKIYSRELSSI